MNKSILLSADVFKTAGCVTNNLDPDQMPHCVASDLCLRCLLRLFCPNT